MTKFNGEIEVMRFNGEIEEIQKLCEKWGYGNVMHTASKMWKEKDGDGAFAVGPCVAFTKKCDCETPFNCNKCHGCEWVMK